MAECLINSIGKALTLVVSSGFATFGRWPSQGKTKFEQDAAKRQMRTIASAYALAMADEPRITREIVEMTGLRYIQGKVTVWEKGEQVQVREELPTAPQFRAACIQTWMTLYTTYPVGETVGALGYVTTHVVTLPKGKSSEEIQAIIENERKRIGVCETKSLPEPAKSTPTLAMVERSLSIHAVKPIEQSETEAAERRKLLRKQAESVGRTG